MSSPAFADNTPIPAEYSCNGRITWARRRLVAGLDPLGADGGTARLRVPRLARIALALSTTDNDRSW